jgi:hypothetical protein
MRRVRVEETTVPTAARKARKSVLHVNKPRYYHVEIPAYHSTSCEKGIISYERLQKQGERHTYALSFTV